MKFEMGVESYVSQIAAFNFEVSFSIRLFRMPPVEAEAN